VVASWQREHQEDHADQGVVNITMTWCCTDSLQTDHGKFEAKDEGSVLLFIL